MSNWKYIGKNGGSHVYHYLGANQSRDGYYYEMIRNGESVKIKEISGNDEKVLFDGYVEKDNELLLLEKILRLSE